MLLNAHSSGTLSHNGDIIGIAAKGRYVVPYPIYSRKLIVKAVVSGLACLCLELG